MKKIQTFSLLLAVFTLFGCVKSLLIIKGIRQPGIENYESEKKFLEKYSLPTDEIISLKDSMGIYKISTKGLSIPDAAFFDSHGNFIPYLSDTITCNAGISSFIEALSKGAKPSIDTSFQMNYLFSELVYSDNQKPLAEGDLNGKYDFYVMIFWTIYTGRLNKDKVHDWYTTIEEYKNTKLNIRAYYVNLDCQEFWGYRKEEIPRFKY